MAPIITVVGSFVVGLTVRTGKMPIFGETLLGSEFDLGPGGKGSNQAIATARFGSASYFAGIIGQDQLAEVATNLYKAESINTDYLLQTADMGTGVAFIIINEEGENGIIVAPEANSKMDVAFVDSVEDQIAKSDLVMTVLEIPVEAAGRAMELGKKHGVRTQFNPAPAAALSDDIIRNIDILTPNETELRILMGLSPDDPTPTEELANQLKQRGVKTIVVTMGEQGALIMDETPIHVPGVKVDVVDTTGAGDAFNGGLAVALAEGKPLLEAVRFANCAGALECTALGVIPGLPQRAEVDALYSKTFG